MLILILIVLPAKQTQIAITEDVKFQFTSEEGFPRELYKDVCEAYIKDIERELASSTELIRQ